MREGGCGRHRAPREPPWREAVVVSPRGVRDGRAAGVLCVLIPMRESRSWWGSTPPAAGVASGLSPVRLDVTALAKSKEILLPSQP